MTAVTTNNTRSKGVLIESEGFDQKVLDASLNGIYIFDIKLGQNVFINKQYTALTGFTFEDLESFDMMQFFELFHPDDRQRVAEHIDKMASGSDDILEIEYRFRTRDGRWMWCLSRDSVFTRDCDGSVSQIIGTFLDISDRIISERALRDSETLYRELVQYANSAIIRWRSNGTITFFNEYAQDFFGYIANEVIGQHVSLLLPKSESTGNELTGLVQDIVDNPQRYINNINENVCRDGRRVWMNWTNKAVTDEKGNVQEIVAIGSDITLLKKTEADLRANREQQALLVTVTERLLRADDPQAIIEDLCRLVMVHLDCQFFFNYLVDVPDQRMQLNAYAGIPDEMADMIRHLDFGVAVCGCVARDGKFIIAENIQHRDDQRTVLVKSFGMQAYCCHPLLAQEKLIGTLSFGTRTRPTFTTDEVSLMKTVSDQVAVSMQRLKVEQRERKEHRETAFANRILRVFMEYEGDDLFDRALAVVQEGMASRYGVFGYIAEPGHLICPSLSKMLDICEIEGKCIHYPPGKWKGLWARALTEKRSFYTNGVPSVPPGHPVIHNNLASPILYRGQVIGLLNLANKEGGYSDEDRQTLDRIADRIAPVLYAWIQRKMREDERIHAEEALRKSERNLKASLAEKEVLLKEIHHRVKNNMQVISSLVALQVDEMQDAAMGDVLRIVTDRIRSMSLVHEKFYQSADLANIDFADYTQSLLNYLCKSHGTTASGIRLDLHLSPVSLPVNTAIPCGLILNELFSNAIKHAFHGRDGRVVDVTLSCDRQGRVRLSLRDNGTGLMPGMVWEQSRSLGLRLVKMLSRQLHATVEVSSAEGTDFTIMFDNH